MTATPMASPTLITTATVQGMSLSDSAVLSGGNNETGVISFTLSMGVFHSPITTQIYTASDPVLGNGTYSTVYTLPTFGPGVYTWTAHYSGNNNNPANDQGGTAEQSFLGTWTFSPIEINWNNPAPIQYGTPLSSVQLDATATIFGNTPSSQGTFTYTPGSGTVLPAGLDSLELEFTPFVSGEYFAPIVDSVPIDVTPAPLTITANNATKPYSSPLPTLSVSYKGFVNGDTPANLTTPPSVTASTTVWRTVYETVIINGVPIVLYKQVPETVPVTASSPVGPYTITPSGAVDPNYNITYASGKLAVTPVLLVITANPATKVYGSPLPAFTVSYKGFVNGDTAASLTRLPNVTTTATQASPVGTYQITPSGAVDSNYNICYVGSFLTITPTPVRVVDTAIEWEHLGVNHMCKQMARMIVLQLSGPVNASTADNVHSYSVTHLGSSMRLISALYNPSNNTIQLRTAIALPATLRYPITVTTPGLLDTHNNHVIRTSLIY